MRLIFILCTVLGLSVLAAERPQVAFIEDILTQSDIAYGTGMKNLVAEVVKVAGADAKQADALTRAAEAAVKEKMDRSREDLWKVWDELQVNEEVNQVAFWNAYRKLPNAQMTPERLPAWETALKSTLTAEQFAKWEKLAAERRGRIDKAVAACLEKGRESWIARRTETRNLLADSLVATYQLDEAQAASLKKGVAEVIAESAKQWGVVLEKQIRDYLKTAFLGGADERLQAVENGAMNFGAENDEESLKREEASWNGLLKSLFKPEQFARYELAEKARQDRRLRSLARVVVAEVDRKVLLTAVQREKLEPLVQRVVTANALKLEGLLAQNYVNSEMLLGVVSELKEEDIKPILEPEQWTGWREAASRMAYFMDQ